MEFTPVPSAAAGRLSVSLLQWERHTATSGSLEAGGPTELMARSIMAQKVGFLSPPDVPSFRRSGQKYVDKHSSFPPSRAADLFQLSGKVVHGTVQTILQRAAPPNSATPDHRHAP